MPAHATAAEDVADQIQAVILIILPSALPFWICVLLLAVLGLLCLGSTRSAQALPPAGPERVLSPSHGSFAKQILSGGPGKDGIPAIESPNFSDAKAADDFLRPQDIVFWVYHQGEAKAYPQRSPTTRRPLRQLATNAARRPWGSPANRSIATW